MTSQEAVGKYGLRTHSDANLRLRQRINNRKISDKPHV